MNKVDLHAAVCCLLNETYAKKNHDYGDSFAVSMQEEGMAAIRVRLTDKLLRFKRLTKLPPEDQKVRDESIQDTLLDLANYAVMTIVEMQCMAQDKPEEGCYCDC